MQRVFGSMTRRSPGSMNGDHIGQCLIEGCLPSPQLLQTYVQPPDQLGPVKQPYIHSLQIPPSLALSCLPFLLFDSFPLNICKKGSINTHGWTLALLQSLRRYLGLHRAALALEVSSWWDGTRTHSAAHNGSIPGCAMCNKALRGSVRRALRKPLRNVVIERGGVVENVVIAKHVFFFL